MLKLTLSIIVVALFAASLLWVNGRQVDPKTYVKSHPEAQKGYRACQVKIIYDGDTFGCDLDNDGRILTQEEHIRMLGIDSPEMHYSRKNHTGKDAPYAKLATQTVEKIILNKTVYLSYDQQPYDHYERSLAYVYVHINDPKTLNQTLLEQGLAKTLFLGKNRTLEPQYQRAQAEAQAAKRNLWSTGLTAIQ